MKTKKNVPLKQVLEVKDRLLFFYAQVAHKYRARIHEY